MSSDRPQLPRLFDDSDAVPGAPESDQTIARLQSAPLPTGTQTAYFIVVAGNSAGEVFHVTDEEQVIGRADDADIRIKDEALSRHHARVVLRGDRVVIEDLNSANGTFVGASKISSTVLRDGDKVQLGPSTILRFNFDELEGKDAVAKSLKVGVAYFDTHKYEQEFYKKREEPFGLSFTFTTERLTAQSAGLARGYGVVCCFVNDQLNRSCLDALKAIGVRMIALRCSGYNNVDVNYAHELGIAVARVPAYSPSSVAEHALALLLSLNRKVHRAHMRTREHNFSLEGMVGYELRSRTVGVVGTGRIGAIFASIVSGLGCAVLAHSPRSRNPQLLGLRNFKYVELDELYARSDIISLHVPLTGANRHMIDADALAKMKDGVHLINTSRGELVDSEALLRAVETGKLGGVGLDVYERESGVFFENFSEQTLEDNALRRLLTFRNVLVTAHQGFLTHEALDSIAETTCFNISQFMDGGQLTNAIVNQRRYHRYRYRARVLITTEGEQSYGPYDTLDISLAGARLRGGIDVPRDRDLSVALMLKYGPQGTEATVGVRARIVRVETHAIALRFVDVSPEALTHLKRTMSWLDAG